MTTGSDHNLWSGVALTNSETAAVDKYVSATAA